MGMVLLLPKQENRPLASSIRNTGPYTARGSGVMVTYFNMINEKIERTDTTTLLNLTYMELAKS
jgi:hypothetical protein